MIRLGTRKSRLAVTQSTYVLNELTRRGIDCKLVEIESRGDQDASTPLYKMEGNEPGLFTKRLEQALLDDEIDLAVHSLKDLPTLQPDGLQLAAVSPRENAGDCIVLKKGSLSGAGMLPLLQGLRIGTSSLRREAILLSQRPDLEILPIRGNVPTRLDRVTQGDVDGVVLAQAGIRRLGLDLSQFDFLPLDETWFVPAPAQGVLGLETRTDISDEFSAALDDFNDSEARQQATLERKILRRLEGGCTLPLGVRCWTGDETKVGVFLGIRKLLDDGHEWVSFHSRTFVGSETEAIENDAADFFGPLVKR